VENVFQIFRKPSSLGFLDSKEFGCAMDKVAGNGKVSQNPEEFDEDSRGGGRWDNGRDVLERFSEGTKGDKVHRASERHTCV
jgi:hypothetical protein